MKALLKSQAEVNLTNSNGNQTSLHTAVAGGQCAAIGVLVEAGGGVNARGPKSYRPIHTACVIGSVEILETLIKYGADLECGSAYGRPINSPAKHGNDAAVVALLTAGSPVDYNPDNYDEFTPLQDAAMGGHAAVATTLLNNGADVNFVSVDGLTALHGAARNNHPDVVDVLMQAGAHPDVEAGEAGATPLHRAVLELAHESAFALLRQGASVDPLDAYGDTPLHIAARETAGKTGSYDMLEILLGWGADEHAVTLGGSTALAIAEYKIEEEWDDDESRPIRETDDYLALLRDSPAGRRWRRRGLVILGRAFPWKLRMGNSREGGEDAAGGSGAACIQALRQPGAGTAGSTSVWGRDADEGGNEKVPTLDCSCAAVDPVLTMTTEREIFYKQIVAFVCWALMIFGRAFPVLRMGNPGEGVEDAAGGSSTTCPPALRQTGAGTAGNTTPGGRDGDKGDNASFSAIGDFRAAMGSLLEMEEDDVFRKIVMFL